MRGLWLRIEERLGEQLFFAYSRKFGRRITEDSLKGCNTQISLLKIPLSEAEQGNFTWGWREGENRKIIHYNNYDKVLKIINDTLIII